MWLRTPKPANGDRHLILPKDSSGERAKPEQSLSSRLAHCKLFSWSPGMLAAEVPLGDDWPSGQLVRQVAYEVEGRIRDGYEMMPVLGDPATVGAILSLVRIRGHDFAHCIPKDGSWVVLSPGSEREILARGRYEGEALALALLAIESIQNMRKGPGDE